MITQVAPNTFLLLLLHIVNLLLVLVLVLLHLEIAIGLLCSIHSTFFHVLLFELLVSNHLHLMTALSLFNLLLLLHHHGIGLHIHGDD